jgi:hypothetical protein
MEGKKNIESDLNIELGLNPLNNSVLDKKKIIFFNSLTCKL